MVAWPLICRHGIPQASPDSTLHFVHIGQVVYNRPSLKVLLAATPVFSEATNITPATPFSLRQLPHSSSHKLMGTVDAIQLLDMVRVTQIRVGLTHCAVRRRVVIHHSAYHVPELDLLNGTILKKKKKKKEEEKASHSIALLDLK